VLSTNFVRRAREVLFNPAIRKHFSVVCHAKKATAQIAHLVFADTRANAKKPKELFYCQTHID